MWDREGEDQNLNRVWQIEGKKEKEEWGWEKEKKVEYMRVLFLDIPKLVQKKVEAGTGTGNTQEERDSKRTS